MSIEGLDLPIEPGETKEHHDGRVQAGFYEEDWDMHARAYRDEVIALAQELENEQDPERRRSLEDQIADLQIGALAAGILDLWKTELDAEIDELKADFRQSYEP